MNETLFVPFKPKNLDRYPRLDTVLMVEGEIHKSRGDKTLHKIWKSLPKQVMWGTFLTIVDYLEYSGKVLIHKDRTVSWIWNPAGVRRILGNPKLVVR